MKTKIQIGVVGDVKTIRNERELREAYGYDSHTVEEAAAMLRLPKRERRAKSRRQVEQENVDTILVALNEIPNVWAAQNKVKHLPIVGGGWIDTGLGTGSADIVFSVTVMMGPICIARIGWLECKTAKTVTKRVDHAARDAHQISWAEAMRRKGHFVAHGIVTVEDALAALDRCWRGEMR